jgi:hypothetical protein
MRERNSLAAGVTRPRPVWGLTTALLLVLRGRIRGGRFHDPPELLQTTATLGLAAAPGPISLLVCRMTSLEERERSAQVVEKGAS